eukprot:GEMP01008339.1.p1 GENE.GEMP01008339.1~~GEMP01008339.1.p1  ORF type:complete len:318 (+),score=46.98 GEMP01008339.1:270-1223(+)
MSCDGVICCLGCLSFVPGFKKNLVNQVAFFPPTPAGYYISEQKQVFLLADSENPQLEPLPDLREDGIQVDTVRIRTEQGDYIVNFHFRRADSTKTIIFSHGNSTDIGIMFHHLRELCLKLRVDIFAYEYTGYGQSTGEPSENALYADIDAAYYYLTEECGMRPDEIVLYGQSVGSAPTIDLASRKPVAGVILHSALKSGLAVIRDVKTTHWFDVFQNIAKIKNVTCPVFIIHGTKDLEVPFDHGIKLYDACPNPFEPWFVPEGGHNDIEVVWRSTFFVRLQVFLSALDQNSIGGRQIIPDWSKVEFPPLQGGHRMRL